MYFSRITFNALVDNQQLAKTLCDDSYREHQAVWQLFDSDPSASRDFMYRQDIERGRICYYLVSERLPVDKTGVWIVQQPKQYNPKLSMGQRLAFMLRANPVVSVTTADGKKHRHDVVMHEQKRIGYKEMPKKDRPPLQQLIQESCSNWLAARASDCGFSVDSDAVIADGYQQHQSKTTQSRPIRYSSVDFQGIIHVTNPALLKKALFSGIGKSKAFGCGLLLVKPVAH